MGYPTKDHLERAKLSFEIFAYLALITLFVVIVFFHRGVIQRVQAAMGDVGIKVDELNAFGVKLKLATESLTISRSSIENLTTYIVCLQNLDCSPDQLKEISQITTGKSPRVTSIESRIDESIRETESAIRAIDRRVEQASASQQDASSDWILIFGADRSIEAAEWEISKVKNRFSRTQILFSDSWFRPVVRFATEQEARFSIPEIAKLVGRQPYVRYLGTWCRNPIAQPRYVECRVAGAADRQ
jgi:hypothetical protein